MPVFQKDNKKVLFIHVPKTAGSSVNKLFVNNGYEMSYYSESSRELHNGLCGPQHMDALLLEDEFRDFSQFDYIFSIFRDPVDRHLSEFTWAPWGLMGRNIYTPERFEEWCPRIFKAYQQTPYRMDNHIRPQHEFYVEGCDVYDYDNIDTLTDKLCDKIGLDNKEMPYERSSRYEAEDYVIYEDTYDCITDFYKGDYQWLKDSVLL